MTNKPNPATAGGISITPQDSEDLLLVEAYGDGGFKLRERRVKGSLYVDGAGFWPIEADNLDSLDIAALDDKVTTNKPEILLIGTGSVMALPPKSLKEALLERGLSYDVMDTGAAARTYNILLLEGRKAAALLLAVA